eukprot:3704069-Rhodomonas_salina.1
MVPRELISTPLKGADKRCPRQEFLCFVMHAYGSNGALFKVFVPQMNNLNRRQFAGVQWNMVAEEICKIHVIYLQRIIRLGCQVRPFLPGDTTLYWDAKTRFLSTQKLRFGRMSTRVLGTGVSLRFYEM